MSKSLSEVAALKTKVETFQVMTEVLCVHIKVDKQNIFQNFHISIFKVSEKTWE